MTIGEKIQHFRKKLNISQEELGNQLSVSRQSVSLWEKDVTMPTVDNIKRLAEIFSVTVDQLMSAEEVAKEEANSEVLYTLSVDDIRKVKFSYISPIVFIICLIVVFTLFGVIINFDKSNKTYVDNLIVMAIFVVILLWIYVSNIRKSLNGVEAKCGNYVYKIEFFEDHLHLKTYFNRKPDLFKYLNYSDIMHIHIIENLYWVQADGISFLVNKNQLPIGCQFFSLLNRPGIKVTTKQMTNGIGVASLSLFVATLLSLFVGIFATVFAMQINNAGDMEFIKYMWAMYFALPIPIASIVVGCVLKKQGRPYKKNIIAGIIFALLLLAYGSFSFIF